LSLITGSRTKKVVHTHIGVWDFRLQR
jgi:hypothetical protein